MKKINLKELRANKPLVTAVLAGLILFCSLILNILMYVDRGRLVKNAKILSGQMEQMQVANNSIKSQRDELKGLYDDMQNQQYISPFSEIERFNELEQRMNDMFGDFDSGFDSQFEVNIIPKGSTFMNFSNTYTINGKTFSYNIQVDGNNINGKISSDDTELLDKYVKKLKDMGINVEVNGNSAKFAGVGMNVNAVLDVFQIESNIQTPETEDEISF